jgi:hypothetical protein
VVGTFHSYAEAMGIRHTADTLSQRSRDAFSELDRETAGANRAALEDIAAKVDALYERVVGQQR